MSVSHVPQGGPSPTMQQLAWQQSLVGYRQFNHPVSLPGTPSIQQCSTTAHIQTSNTLLQQHLLQQWQLQGQLALPNLQAGAGTAEMQHLQLASLPPQQSVNHHNYEWMQALDLRPDHLPFWQIVQEAAAEASVSTGAVAAVQHLQLEQLVAGASGAAAPVLPQHLVQVISTPVQLLQSQQPQQPTRLQATPGPNLLLVPPRIRALTGRHRLLLQPGTVSGMPCQQQAQLASALFAAPQAAAAVQPRRKTRRGPNRGRSKHQEDQQLAAQAAEADAQVTSLRAAVCAEVGCPFPQPQGQQTGLQDNAGGRAAITSDGSLAHSNMPDSSSSGGANLGCQTVGVVALSEQGVTSPEKKRVKGCSNSAQDLQHACHSQSAEQHNNYAASSAGAVKARPCQAQQHQALVLPVTPSSSTASASADAAQQPKRATGRSHRQRYRRKRWQLHNAQEEEQARQQRFVPPQFQLQTPQRSSAAQSSLTSAASAAGLFVQLAQDFTAAHTPELPVSKQLQSSPATDGTSLLGYAAQQYSQELLHTLRQAAAPATTAAGASTGSLTSAVEVSLADGPLDEGQEADATVDADLDAWLTKLLEL